VDAHYRDRKTIGKRFITKKALFFKYLRLCLKNNQKITLSIKFHSHHLLLA
jgi:hypothetical protein